jgi:hypothetical protein
MKALLRKIEAALAAAAFAEEGEADTARRMLAQADADRMAGPLAEEPSSSSALRPHAPLAKGSRA